MLVFAPWLPWPLFLIFFTKNFLKWVLFRRTLMMKINFCLCNFGFLFLHVHHVFAPKYHHVHVLNMCISYVYVVPMVRLVRPNSFSYFKTKIFEFSSFFRGNIKWFFAHFLPVIYFQYFLQKTFWEYVLLREESKVKIGFQEKKYIVRLSLFVLSVVMFVSSSPSFVGLYDGGYMIGFMKKNNVFWKTKILLLSSFDILCVIYECMWCI